MACVDLAAPAVPPRRARLAADVTDEASIEAAVAATIDRFGRVDVLYANAGVPSAGQVHETIAGRVAAGARRQPDRRLPDRARGAGDMLARGSGSILLQASVGGITGVRGIAAYSASKGGVAALAQQMAADYSERGIRVPTRSARRRSSRRWSRRSTASAPGAEAAAADLADRARDFPLGHMGAVEDVANLALFLASRRARWITGAVYPVDGGATAVRPPLRTPACDPSFPPGSFTITPEDQGS